MADRRITMYGTSWCSDCKRSKMFLGEHRIPYDFVDVEQDAEGLALVERINHGKRSVPTIVFQDDGVLVEPSNTQLADKLGLSSTPKDAFYDLVVIGGGPAGLTAALYAARDGLDTLVVERSALGGQAGITERLDNFPGFPEGIAGSEFADRLVRQCRRFGVELLEAATARGVRVEGQYRVTDLGQGRMVSSTAVLLTPGTTYRRLGAEGEDDFIGAGVHFCATCDGPFYGGQEMMVVGGANSAAQEAVFLARFASHVTIVTRGRELSASQIAQRKIAENPNVDVVYGTRVKAFRGHGQLESVVLEDVETGAEREVRPPAVFVFIGLHANTELVRGTVDLNEDGFIVTGPTMETSVPGVFAAGDARAGSTKQLISAAGEGAAAAIMIREWLQSHQPMPAERGEPVTLAAR